MIWWLIIAKKKVIGQLLMQSNYLSHIVPLKLDLHHQQVLTDDEQAAGVNSMGSIALYGIELSL